MDYARLSIYARKTVQSYKYEGGTSIVRYNSRHDTDIQRRCATLGTAK